MQKYFRPPIRILLLALFYNVFVGCHSQDAPNILVILTDDQGYHDVSYYGTEDIRTPHIDALRNDGIRFDNFYANCPVCSPTRASLLTGTYPDQVGVPGVIRTYPEDNWGHLSDQAIMLPDQLKKADYHTALIGKWHLGLEAPNRPTDRGFDYFHGWLGDMMDDYWVKRRHEINYMRHNTEQIDPPGHATDIFTDWAVDYVKDRQQQEQPFFLYLAYNAPHFPVQPPKDWLESVKMREPQVTQKRAELIAFIEHLDDGIGKVVEALKNTGQYDNTLIIFTSDNGGLLRDEANNGPLRDGKQSMYEGGLKVPTCMVWKNGGIVPGSASPLRAATMDIFATALDAAGLDIPGHLPCVSFLPELQGEKMSAVDRPFYFVRREGNQRYRGLTIQAVLLNEWKLLQNNPFEDQELYNLRADPQEKNNLIATERDKFAELNQLLMTFIQEGGRVPWQRPNSEK